MGESKSIQNSGDYLKALLEDTGALLLRPKDISADNGDGLLDKMKTLDLLSETKWAVPVRADENGADLWEFVEYFANQLCRFDNEKL